MGDEKPASGGAKQTPPAPKIEIGRRKFLQLAVALGGLLALVPYVPVGRNLSEGGGSSPKAKGQQRIFLEDGWITKAAGNTVKAAQGKFANVKEAPTNSFAVFVYPRTGDKKIDTEPFRTYVIIRLPGSKDPIPADYPKELFGDMDDLSSFRVYSRICLHLYCLPSYSPVTNPNLFARPGRDYGPALAGKQGILECPCHGSIYRVRDGLAVGGPAWLQTPPNNALPALLSESRDESGNIKLDPVSVGIDNEGFLYVKPDVNLNDFNANGIVRLGRWIKGLGRRDQEAGKPVT